ncbi:MAG: exonuclease domain-containing protein [Erysipelotrichaceae bacterium]|nr:exonuclease domain-containing protein [Erysipelotrichaceae bacterium]
MHRKKGLSLLKFLDDYTVVDIETTGNSLYYDEIIEISALKYRNNILFDQFSSLVQCDRKISPFIYELTGISNEMIADAPRLSEVLGDFINFIGDDIILGHNVNFDINFLYDSAARLFNHSLSNDFVDTLRLSRRIMHVLENHKLTTIANHFRIERSTHRGLVDCEVTHHVYQKIRERVNPDDLDLNGNLRLILNPTGTNYQDNLSTIQPTVSYEELLMYGDEFFFEKNVVITGKLSCFTKQELGQIIVNQGGYFSDSMNYKTNILILGNTDYQESIYNAKSGKHIKAEKMLAQGFDIIIIDENTAYSLLGLSLS